jgi:hypothetical protein
MNFHHNGNIVTIDQLSFVVPNLIIKNLIPMNVPYMKMVSHPPRVNYAASCSMHSNINDKDPLFVFLPSLDLDLVVVMVNHSIGDLEVDIPLVTPIEFLDMYPFQRIVLVSDEYLLQAMVKGFNNISRFCVKVIKK